MVQYAMASKTVPTEQIVERMLESGRYSNEQEVIVAGIRLLMDYSERLENLENEIEKGVTSGNYHEIDGDEFLKRAHKSKAK